tara:strand:+ start:2172 stop:3527 length:1356 start_codon:yes stop_codon:yes gene_type:complete
MNKQLRRKMQIFQKSYSQFLKIEGEHQISGHIHISGSKNASLVLMAASLLSEESIEIENVPELTDIDVMEQILLSLGAKVVRNLNSIRISTRFVNPSSNKLSDELVKSLRASFFCIGPLLARFGKVKIPFPGGCDIGSRPLDELIRGLKLLGANVSIQNKYISAKIENSNKRLKGTNVKFNCKSVGATKTIIMASVLAQGKTIIENAAQEPEIEDLIIMLNKMGAKILGKGTQVISIEGVDRLTGCSHKVIPDRIEAGTFLIASAITGCPLTISPIISEHIDSVLLKLKECGCLIEKNGRSIIITPSKNIISVDIKTESFPGFPTDLQAPFMALMTISKGTAKIEETIFENRMQHVQELRRMGAQIELIENIAWIKGVKHLKGALIKGSDLRSTAALVLGSLVAKGTSKLKGLHHLDRGYEKFEHKLVGIGAHISRNNPEERMLVNETSQS